MTTLLVLIGLTCFYFLHQILPRWARVLPQWEESTDGRKLFTFLLGLQQSRFIVKIPQFLKELHTVDNFMDTIWINVTVGICGTFLTYIQPKFKASKGSLPTFSGGR